MLNKSISVSTQADSLSDQATILFTWMIAHGDDEGRLLGVPKYVKGIVVPLKSGRKWHEISIEKYILDINNAGLIHYWYQGGTRYIQFTGWKEHQTIQSDRAIPSKIPEYNPLKAKDAKELPDIQSVSAMDTKSIQDTIGLETQYNISKDNIIEFKRKEGLVSKAFKNTGKAGDNKIGNPGIKNIIAYFIKSVQELKRFSPDINWARDGWLVKRRLTNYTEKQLKELIDSYLESDACEKLGCSLGICMSSTIINQWLGGSLKKNNKITKI